MSGSGYAIDVRCADCENNLWPGGYCPNCGVWREGYR